MDDGQFEDAERLFNRAIDLGFREPEAYLQRAYVRRGQDDRDGASTDAMRTLQSEKASPLQIRRSLTLIKPDELKRFAESSAVPSFSPDRRLLIALRLTRSKNQMEMAAALLRPLTSDGRLSEEKRERARRELVLLSIGLGSFVNALRTIRDKQPEVSRMNIEYAFNYGMALWGEHAAVVPEPFARVVEIEQSRPESSPSANYLQCMAVAYWVVGRRDEAVRSAQLAKQVMRSRGGWQFSCWRYRNVPAPTFVDDVDNILRLIEGVENVAPLFLNSPRTNARAENDHV